MTLLVRATLVVLTASVCVLVFGPFGGQEAKFGFNDKEAHTLAFFTLTALSLAAMPRLRKWDVALIILAFGGVIEVVQTFVGRSGSITDWMADGLGIGLCLTPMLLQDLRAFMRQDDVAHPPRRRRSDETAPTPAGLASDI